MTLWHLIILFIAAGVGLYVVNHFIPMEPRIKQILNIVVLIIVVFVLLEAFGIIDVLRSTSVGSGKH